MEPSHVVRLQMEPYPEGPPGPLFQRNPSDYGVDIDAIVHRIPVPLPAALDQGWNCDFGGIMEIELQDGRVIAYGPCRWPVPIERLWYQATDIFAKCERDPSSCPR